MRILSEPHFHCEEAAYERLEAIVWSNGPVCPHCGGMDRITVVGGKTARPGLKRCLQCKLQFRATVGTVFESSHIKLHLWFQAAHLLASSKKGISSHQLHRTLKVTYKTAWFMAHRLREAMRDGHFSPLGGEGQVVEIDETFVGGKEKNKHANKRQHLGTGGVGKEAVLSLVERGGKVRSHQRYPCEFDFRYNERSASGVEDSERTTKALRGIVGKRLTYRGSRVGPLIG